MILSEEEIKYTIALTNTKGLGISRCKKLIRSFSGAEEVFCSNKSEIVKRSGISSKVLSNFPDKQALEFAERETEFIVKNKIDFLRFDSSEYPFLLKQLVDSPVFIVVKGNYSFDFNRAISIVGTRNMTNYGRAFCEDLFRSISKYNPTIISGLAYGVDIWAHKLALKYQLQNFAVVAHGLNQIYPKIHLPVAREIMQNGALISEFTSDSKPDRENFPQRNRIIAGLSKHTIVIEAAIKGGALITADFANDYNRDVFALPGRRDDPFSAGCNKLIQENKAILLSSPDELVSYLEWSKGNEKKVIQKSLFIETTFEENRIIELLIKEDKNLDRLALELNMEVHKLVGILLEMELKNLIKPLPGKLFRLL